MVIISKQLFYNLIGPEIKCQHIIHPGSSNCIKTNLQLMLRVSKGIFIFYLPIHLTKLLLDYKKVNKKRLKNTIIAFLKSQSFASGFAIFVLSSFCIASKIQKRFYFHNFGLIPGFTSGLSIFFEQPEARYLNTLLWLNMVFEAFFRNVYFFKIMTFSPTKETIIFMMISAVLMHLLTTQDKTLPLSLWFYQPKKLESVSEERNLPKLCLNEFLKYFGVGFAISLVRKLASKFAQLLKSPGRVLMDSFINKQNLSLGMLCGCYAFLYKITDIFLQKYNKKKKYVNGAIAGFIAGLAYRINPTINILTIAMVTILQVLCVNVEKHSKIISKLPLTELLFSLCNGILLYNRICIYNTCPKYYANMLKIGSNGAMDEIYARVIKTYLVKN